MQKDTMVDWYNSWFDTPYYHVLYKDRDHVEAEAFMTQLTHFLELPKGAEILDLACGKGRHSIFLNRIGYKVTGVDLSKSSIAFASQYQSDTLHFKEHDMSIALPQRFDAVFNLFTSFGYFDSEKDNLRTIQAIMAQLKEEGDGVIDFLNSSLAIKNLVPKEVKTIDGINFYIEKAFVDGYIIKHIKFNDNGKDYHFTEKVKALSLENFQHYFEKAGVRLKHVFGDYKLSAFDIASSERLILIFGQ